MTLDLPAPPTSPSALPIEGGPRSPFAVLPGPLGEAMEKRGFTALTAVQRAVLAADADGRDLQISSQTGSGKTVALGFVLARCLQDRTDPETKGGPFGLVIVPTRELATQVCSELQWLLAGIDGASAASVTGGTPVYRDRATLAQRPSVLVGTPGRLLDHVKSGALDLGRVRELVLDEADQMLDMGFREELEGILDATAITRRTHLVSATFPEGIQRLAERYQDAPVAIEGTRLGEANQDIEHVVYTVRSMERYALLVNLLLLADGARTLVFVKQRAEAAELAERLSGDGFAALPLSGELIQRERSRTLAAFREGRATVLVATDVAARGIDVPDVATVIHTSPPIDAQVYTHRSGRTGRAGARGRSLLMAPPSRKRRLVRMMREAGIEASWPPSPSADEVRDELAARARKALESELQATFAKDLPERQLAHAEELLARFAPGEAQRLVAALLTKLDARSDRTEPREVSTPPAEGRERTGRRETTEPRGARSRGEYRGRSESRSGSDHRSRSEGRSRSEYRSRSDDRSRPEGRPRSNGSNFEGRPRREHRSAPGGGPRLDARSDFRTDARPGSENMVRFFTNRGANQGANPRRVLASICRRGGVQGSDVGSIAVHPNASTFDIRAEVAERFERLAARRDPRDRKTIIRRDRGPQPK